MIERGIKVTENRPFADATPAFRFAASVIEYAEILRESKHVDIPRLDSVLKIAEASKNNDREQNEFIGLA